MCMYMLSQGEYYVSAFGVTSAFGAGCGCLSVRAPAVISPVRGERQHDLVYPESLWTKELDVFCAWLRTQCVCSVVLVDVEGSSRYVEILQCRAIQATVRNNYQFYPRLLLWFSGFMHGSVLASHSL